ncbi:hypothetical protein [Aquicella lusitana]|uniref:Uncharacterized protein n=1 Tax=Aquicella lusitana TaxID=254246 RepID=A0A370GYC3_9COXI|nr:hypothetical protein [Aquicella lusitana]RDI48652.1 hypothetical protein C8D86_10280 [Aquicella lusitana]VVC73971.1 hypothetical protein AQULUS_17330 [Aquicella lusitana]
MADKQIKQKSIGISLLAGLVYGSWAFYINHAMNPVVALYAALAQGILSFFVTGVMTVSMEICFINIKQRMLRFMVTVFFPLLFVLAIMAFIHFSIGTPRVIKTILPSAIVGGCYCFFYTLTLFHFQKKSPAPA